MVWAVKNCRIRFRFYEVDLTSTNYMSWSGSCNASLLFRHTSHVSDSLLNPWLSDNIFHFRRSYFHFSVVQDTLPHCRRKIKRVRWFAGDWCPPNTLFIHSTRYFVTYQMFYLRSASVTPADLDDAVENIINLSPRRIRIRLSAEDDVGCVVPGELSVSKAYKVCYISKWKQRWKVYSKQLPAAALLHNKPASTGIPPGNFCAQGLDKRYALYDVNLFPP